MKNHKKDLHRLSLAYRIFTAGSKMQVKNGYSAKNACSGVTAGSKMQVKNGYSATGPAEAIPIIIKKRILYG